MGAIRFGPARWPSRDSPEEAIQILRERGYDACELDFESGFWLDYPAAERLGADAFLLKPFTPKALRVSLEAMMRQPRVRVA